MNSSKRRRVWLAAAVSLLLGGALVLSLGEKEPVRTRVPRVDFPSRMRPSEEERAKARATLSVPVPSPASGVPEAEPVKRDPFLVSLPVLPGEPVVVLEANALRHSRLGERFVGCLLARDPDTFARFARETGIDPLKDVDRVGFVGESLVLSGFFGGVNRELLAEAAVASDYGRQGRLYAPRSGKGIAAATWGDGLIVLGDETSVRRSLDQLEGRAPVPDAGISDDMAYGEAYGVIPGEAVRRLLAGTDTVLADRIADAASRVELHVDAMADVAAVVRIRGEDTGRMDDLARSVGAALAVARLVALAWDDRRAFELLEHARVVDQSGSFRVEVAVPAERLDAFFEGCDRRRPRPGAEDAGP